MVEKSQLLSFDIPNFHKKQNLIGEGRGARDIDEMRQRNET